MADCASCPFLVNAEKKSKCTQEYGCNPYWKHGSIGKIVSENWCGTCKERLEKCPCSVEQRQIVIRRTHLA